MGLPPLQPVPVISRLLAPDEQIIYTARFHPFLGWYWLCLGVGCAVLGAVYGLWPLWGVSAICCWLWGIPFFVNEMAVTNLRLLLRVGKFKLRMEAISATQLETWRVRQTLLTNLLHCGTVVLVVREGRDMRHIVLPWVWHPVTFIEALETLQPELRVS